MKILHLMASHRWTGAAEPAARLAAQQTQLGHDVLFSLTAGRSFDSKAQELGVKTSDQVEYIRKYWPWTKMRDGKNLSKLVSDFQPDVIHSHLTHDHLLAAFTLGKNKSERPPLIRTFHRERKPRGDWFTRKFVMARTSGAIGISEQLTNQLKDAYQHLEVEFETIGGGLDTDQFQPRNRSNVLREKWNIDTKAPVIGIVSRLRLERGIGWLMDATEKSLSEIPDAKLVICGRGNYQREMVERLKTHPSKDQIHYAGYVKGQDLLDAYEAFDVALMLKPGNDGACRSALEAMATGKPVIGGKLGAIKDLLNHDRSPGWLCEPDDINDLAARMKEALLNLDECKKRGQNARVLMESEYSEKAMAEKTMAFYERVLSNSN